MERVNDPGSPSPTEVISSWIPHDARFRESALRHALRDTSGRRLHVYVDSLVNRANDDGSPLSEYDLRTMAAVREDLDRRPLTSVDWRTVRARLVSGLF
ncbi:hypothetical protein [Nocardiopsis valliformis]|uniref:hypothetical protein n=1 Tax=Nocardiopsis valliformis TaxID=239974 RepID=UPI00037D43F0|nr:hypothetical protein [Nocardiopsis valliformis]